MKTLYVSDMDGTLLNRDSVVSSRSAAMLSEIVEAGALFTVATARTPATVEPLLAQVRTDLPAIVMTGAALWDRRRQRYVDPIFLSRDEADAAVRECLREGVHPFVYRLGEDNFLNVYHSRPEMTRPERHFVEDRLRLKLKKFHLGVCDSRLFGHDDAILLFAIGPLKAIYRLRDWLLANTDCSVSAYPDIFHPETANLEIFGPGVSKAAAIRRLADRVGADSVTVFGDNLNDLPMFDVADRAVAVANAVPEVLDRADLVIGQNTIDSVPKFIYDEIF